MERIRQMEKETSEKHVVQRTGEEMAQAVWKCNDLEENAQNVSSDKELLMAMLRYRMKRLKSSKSYSIFAMSPTAPVLELK